MSALKVFIGIAGIVTLVAWPVFFISFLQEREYPWWAYGGLGVGIAWALYWAFN